MLPRALLIAAVVLSADTARADLVTPDSISPAPLGWVTDQYKRLGLVFNPQYGGWPAGIWAVGTYNLGGAWTSETTMPNRDPNGVPIGPGDPGVPAGIQSVTFVMPGTGAPATTDSIRVHVLSPFDAVFTLKGYDSAGNQIVSRDMIVGMSSDNWLTLRASRMHSFAIFSDWPPSPFPAYNSPPINIEGIEFHPMPAVPEPGGLVLSGLGALILTLARLSQGHRVRQG